VVEHQEVCIALVRLSGNLKLNLCSLLEKRSELEETPSLCGSLNNDGVGSLGGFTEPQSKYCGMPLGVVT